MQPLRQVAINKDVREEGMFLQQGYPPAKRGKIVIWGMLAHSPFGGMTWQVLQHLAGVRRLGFDVWYVEDANRPVFHPSTFCSTSDATANIAYMARQMERIGLSDRWIFRPPGVCDTYVGACGSAGLAQLYKEADAVLNLCGAQELRLNHQDIRCLVYLETDPVANQIGVANGCLQTIETFAAYDVLFTYGANFGAPDCRVPLERF